MFFAVCRDLVDVLDLMKLTTVDCTINKRFIEFIVLIGLFQLLSLTFRRPNHRTRCGKKAPVSYPSQQL